MQFTIFNLTARYKGIKSQFFERTFMKNEATDNPIVDKSEVFAVQIINLCKDLDTDRNSRRLADQIVRSGTSIGANVAEAVCAFSKPDFYAKMSIALKEANETLYWLKLLWRTNYIDENQYTSSVVKCEELIRILIAILKNKDNAAKK